MMLYTIIKENPIVHSELSIGIFYLEDLSKAGESRLNSIENTCKNFYKEGLQIIGKCHIILDVLEIQAFLIFLKVIA